jgi:hypothetical protein
VKSTSFDGRCRKVSLSQNGREDSPSALGVVGSPTQTGGSTLSKDIEPKVPQGLDLGQLRNHAKNLKRRVRAGDVEAIERMARSHPKYLGRPPQRLVPERMTLRDAQATLAHELGFVGWKELVEAAERAETGASAPRWSDRADVSLVQRTLRQGQVADHEICGPDEILLAILDPPLPTAASTVLADAGLTHEMVRASTKFAARSGTGHIVTNPAWSECMGMAQGLALAAGSTRVADEDALLALLYQGFLDHYLDGVELTAAELAARLADRGVAVSSLLPAEPSPPLGPIGPRVYFPCDERGVTLGLRGRIRSRAWWGFNRDESGRCYVQGEEDADLPNLVRSLVADPASVEIVLWDETEQQDQNG